MDDFENINVEDLVNKKPAKKKKNGCRKGKTVERQLCKILTDHFGVDFTRSVGSGNRWGQVTLSETAKQVFTGDISVPEGFKWVIESKGGYEKDIDMNAVCDGGITRLDSFIEQSLKDSEYCGRKPIVCWKRSRKPWLIMILLEDLAPFKEEIFPYRIHYRDWLILNLDDLLKLTNRKFWFSN
jgi:Holliday junction resolvase